MPNKAQKLEELKKAGAPEKTASLIVNQVERADAPIPNGHPVQEDHRETAREENTHFTNRADARGR